MILTPGRAYQTPKSRAYQFAGTVAIAFCAIALHATPFTTVQNGTLSVPAAIIAAPGVPGSTNLVGSNFLMSAVSPATSQNGHAWLGNSVQWVQRYQPPPSGFFLPSSGAQALVVRSDRSIVATGFSSSSTTKGDFLTIAYSNDGKPLWTNLYDGPAHGADMVSSVATSPAGDVWVAGSSARSSTNSQLTDAILIKYSGSGVPLWTNNYSSASTNGESPEALITDSTGNAFVLISSVYWPGGSFGTPVGNTLIKYGPSGVPLWTNQYPDYASTGLGQIGPIALDQAGNLLITGELQNGHFNVGTALVKLTTDGIPVWTNSHPYPFMSPLRSLLIDRNGDAVLTGESFKSPNVGYVVMKVSAAGDSLWTNSIVGPTYDGGNVPQTVLDPAGNVFLTGGASNAPSLGLYQILKVSSNGLPLWTNLNVTFTQPTNTTPEGSATDSAGNLYLCGYASSSNADVITIKFSADGLALWTNRFDGGTGQNDYPYAIANDAGNLYVAGQSGAQFTVVKYADLMFYRPPKDFTGTDTISYTVTDSLGNQATTNSPVLVVPGEFQLSVSSPTNLTPSGLNFTLNTTPGTNTVVIQTSADLINWQPILTNSGVNGSINLLDPPAANLPRRFYRAVIQGFSPGP